MILSIIIPSFQLGHEIQGALKSIRQQAFSGYEIIIMDGGSTDDTIKVVNAEVDLPITFIQESDLGVYDAMNKGVRIAKGKWLYFMGADDRLHIDVLKILEDDFLKDDVDILYGNVVMSSDGIKYNGQFDLLKLVCECNICHQAIFYQKKVFNKIGNYNLRYKIWSDWDFNIRCFKYEGMRIKYRDIIVAIYNNQTGVSAEPDALFSKELPAFYLAEINDLKLKNNHLLSSKAYIIGSKIVSIANMLRLKKFF